MSKLIDSLSEKLENATVVLGLQPKQIEIIETELERFGNREIDAKYVKYIWEKLGKELAWEPFALALYYFEYLEEKNKWFSVDENPPVQEESDYQILVITNELSYCPYFIVTIPYLGSDFEFERFSRLYSKWKRV